MMRQLAAVAAWLLTAVLFAESPAFAQDGREPKSDAIIFQPGVGLLGYYQVSNELKLTADQVAKIKGIGEGAMQKAQKTLQNPNATKEERQKAMAEYYELQKDISKMTSEFLTPEQSTRLMQIEIWDAGPLAFTDPRVVKELKLTEQQTGVLKTIGAECMNKLQDAARRDPTQGRIGGGVNDGDVAKFKSTREEILAASEAECMKALTDDQQAEFKKLRGPKFEIDMSAFRKPQGAGK
jgi:hypothetical protein